MRGMVDNSLWITLEAKLVCFIDALLEGLSLDLNLVLLLVLSNRASGRLQGDDIVDFSMEIRILGRTLEALRLSLLHCTLNRRGINDLREGGHVLALVLGVEPVVAEPLKHLVVSELLGAELHEFESHHAARLSKDRAGTGRRGLGSKPCLGSRLDVVLLFLGDIDPSNLVHPLRSELLSFQSLLRLSFPLAEDRSHPFLLPLILNHVLLSSNLSSLEAVDVGLPLGQEEEAIRSQLLQSRDPPLLIAMLQESTGRVIVMNHRCHEQKRCRHPGND
mmetsp:Transcript_24645/g.55683  ORF Transcript_24645/g.55683 Transcript_24645/m.55683 type:complete len:276 (+) Transcript_24645:755-1582(+)